MFSNKSQNKHASVLIYFIRSFVLKVKCNLRFFTIKPPFTLRKRRANDVWAAEISAKSKTGSLELGKTVSPNLRRPNCSDTKTSRAELLFGVVFRCFYSAWRHVRFRCPLQYGAGPAFIICFIGHNKTMLTITNPPWKRQ